MRIIYVVCSCVICFSSIFPVGLFMFIIFMGSILFGLVFYTNFYLFFFFIYLLFDCLLSSETFWSIFFKLERKSHSNCKYVIYLEFSETFLKNCKHIRSVFHLFEANEGNRTSRRAYRTSTPWQKHSEVLRIIYRIFITTTELQWIKKKHDTN